MQELLATTLAREVMQSPPSVHLFQLLTFEPSDFDPFACVWVMAVAIIAILGLKLTDTGQS